MKRNRATENPARPSLRFHTFHFNIKSISGGDAAFEILTVPSSICTAVVSNERIKPVRERLRLRQRYGNREALSTQDFFFKVVRAIDDTIDARTICAIKEDIP